MSKGFRQLKEMFDKIDQNEESDEDYNENEGENIVIKNKRDKVRKNIKNLDKVKDELKKYNGKNTSYSKIKLKQEEESDSNNNNNEQEEEEEQSEDKEEEQIESSIEEKDYNVNKSKPTKEQMDKEDEEYLKKLTQYTPNEIKKAKNVENQKNIYDYLLGLRISFQPLLTSINSLPSYQTLNKFISLSDDQTKSNYIHIQNSLSLLLSKILTVHKKLIMKSNLPSTESFDPINSINTLINSLKSEEQQINSINIPLLSFHDKLSLIAHKIINIWYRKSLVNSFKVNNKILNVLKGDFCKNILSNINDNYESYRKNTQKINNEKLLGRKRLNEEDYQYDKEIYNDIDFYNKLLKDFLINNERELEQNFDNENRMDLTLKAIMNKQNKIKKNVDTKASKNRKIRYDKHEKIINFMVPKINTIEAVGRDIIVNSLFGMKRKINSNKEQKDEEENDVPLI